MRMKNIARRATIAAAIVLTSTMTLGACGGGAAASAGKSGTAVADTITAQVAYASRDFSPATTSGALPMAANWHVTEPLYALDYSDFSVYNALAKGEPERVSDTEFVVNLRDGAKFSDGTPVTSEDVVKSVERTTAEGSLYVSMLDFIKSVEAKGDSAVTFHLTKPFPMFKQRLALIQITPADANADDLKNQPIGSGPWKYENITDQQVKFVKNDQYNGDYPAQTKNMVWNVTVDDTARVTAMQGGKTDVMEMVPANAFKTLEASGSELKPFKDSTRLLLCSILIKSRLMIRAFVKPFCTRLMSTSSFKTRWRVKRRLQRVTYLRSFRIITKQRTCIRRILPRRRSSSKRPVSPVRLNSRFTQPMRRGLPN